MKYLLFQTLILVFGIFVISYNSVFSVSTISNHLNEYIVYALSTSISDMGAAATSSSSSSVQVLEHKSAQQQQQQYQQQQQQQQQPRQYQEIIQSKNNVVKLLADIVRNKLHEAVNILEITSREPAVQHNQDSHGNTRKP
jgi:hypothetical protein